MILKLRFFTFLNSFANAVNNQDNEGSYGQCCILVSLNGLKELFHVF